MRPLASLQFNASALSANIASHNSSCGLLTPRFSMLASRCWTRFRGRDVGKVNEEGQVSALNSQDRGSRIFCCRDKTILCILISWTSQMLSQSRAKTRALPGGRPRA